MIAKAFQKFSFTSAGISSLLLLVVTYYYLTLEIKWSFVESKIFLVLESLNFRTSSGTRK